MRKALLVVIALAMAVTVTTVYALNSTLTTTSRPSFITVGNQTTIIASVNNTVNIPEGHVLAKRVSGQGSSLEIYLPPTAVKKGDPVIIHVIIRNKNDTGGLEASSGTITVTDSNGNAVYQGPFARTLPEPLKLGGRWEVTGIWHTGSSYKGITPQPGTYRIQVTLNAPLDNLQPASNRAEANLTLSK